MSYLLSLFLQPILITSEVTCSSTEDLLYRIDNCNKNEDLRDCIIGSFDVEALYPSIDINFAVDKCVDLLFESGINYNNININELGLYLMITNDNDLMKKADIIEFCPSRKRKGKKHTITASGSNTNQKKRWDGWLTSTKTVEKEIERKMMSIALGVALKAVLANHIYVFNNKYYRQLNGAAIGVGVAGDVANVFMIWWDRQMKRSLNMHGIEIKLYTRYVDDGNVVIKSILASELDNKEEMTMNKIKDIGNAIHPTIQIKVNYPSNHENNRIPVLDTEQWIEQVTVNGEEKPQILHSHYMKSMSNKYVVHKESAMSQNIKINILTADLVRIMRNISELCKPIERETKIQQYINRLQYSGYNKRERVIIYKKANKVYTQIKKNDKENVCPLYRGKFWKQKERMVEKSTKKRNWYKKGGHKAVFFVDATKNQKLVKECQQAIDHCNLRIKVVEKSGEPIKNKLVRSNPFSETKCKDESCLLCLSGQEINCKLREITYQVCCADTFKEGTDACDGRYEGETSRSSGERLGEHLKEYAEHKKESMLIKHMIEAHNGEQKGIKIKITGHYPNDATIRQLTEAIIIKETDPGLNKKEEWGNRNVPRERITNAQRNPINPGLTSSHNAIMTSSNHNNTM